jgi:hypothetical protein
VVGPDPASSAAGHDNLVLSAAKNANLALAFFLELAVLVAIGMWAFGLSDRTIVRVLATAGAVVGFATLWGVFGAPGATVSLPGPAKIAFFLIWFGLGALALASTGRTSLAVIFFAVYLLSLSLSGIWHQS